MRYCITPDCGNFRQPLGDWTKVCDQCGERAVTELPSVEGQPSASAAVLPPATPIVAVSSPAIRVLADFPPVPPEPLEVPRSVGSKTWARSATGARVSLQYPERFFTGETAQVRVSARLDLDRRATARVAFDFSPGFLCAGKTVWLSDRLRVEATSGSLELREGFCPENPGEFSLRAVYLLIEYVGELRVAVLEATSCHLPLWVGARHDTSVVIQAQNLNNYGRVIGAIGDATTGSGEKQARHEVPVDRSTAPPQLASGARPVRPVLFKQGEARLFLASDVEVYIGRASLDVDGGAGSHLVLLPLPLSDPENRARASRISRRHLQLRYDRGREEWELSQLGQVAARLGERVLAGAGAVMIADRQMLQIDSNGPSWTCALDRGARAIVFSGPEPSAGTRYAAFADLVGVQAKTLALCSAEEGDFLVCRLFDELWIGSLPNRSLEVEGVRLTPGDYFPLRGRCRILSGDDHLTASPATIEDFAQC